MTSLVLMTAREGRRRGRDDDPHLRKRRGRPVRWGVAPAWSPWGPRRSQAAQSRAQIYNPQCDDAAYKRQDV